MAEDIVSIGIALDTSKVLQGTRQVDAALKSVATASAATAQATKQIDAAARTASQAMTGESAAAQAVTNALRQEAQASGTVASQTGEVSRASQAAATALQKESQAAAQAAATLDKTGQASGQAATLMQRLGSSMGAIGQQAASFAVAQVGVQSLEQALSGVVNFASSSVRAALQTESLSAAFKAIEGSGQAAGKTMQFLKDTANRLGVDVVALSTGFKTVDAASRGTSLQGEQIRKVFVAMAEASRVLGLSGNDLNGVLLAVGQSISKGTVQAEELRGQIGERLPGAFQLAARAMGVTTTELDKMMERGELQATTFWPRFAETIRKEFGGSVEEASKTAGAAFERFHNTMREFQVNVGQWVIPPLQWMLDKATAVAGAMNKAADATRNLGKAQSDAAAEAQRLAGGKDVATGLQGQFVAAQAEEQAARAARERIQASTWAGDKVRLAQAQEAENAAIEKRIALGRQLEAASKRSTQGADPFGEGVEIGGRDEKRVAAQQQLADMVKANRVELEKLDQVTQQLYDRKPTQDEILKTTEKQVETTRKWIDANQANWNILKDTGPAKELRAQASGSEALEKSIKAAGEATRAKDKADSEAEQKRKQAEKDAEDNARKRIDRFKELGAEEDRHIEQLRRMAAQYGEVKTSRDVDTASQLAQNLATSQYREEAEKALEVIKAGTKALEDRRKVEEKVPKLREEAEASAGALRDIERLQKQLEPSRRGRIGEEQLAATRAELAARSKGDLGVMARADAQIKKTLDTEIWNQWADAGMNALDHVGDALTDFALKGKLTFKDMLGAIADDLFRFATQQLFQSATKKGGWLDLGFQAFSTLLSAGKAAGGAPREGDPSFIGPPRRQHGGPVSAGSAYMVGEAGPELYVPKTSGTIIPNNKLSSGPTVINVHVSGVQDAQSFVQSRGAVSRAMMGALAQARQQM